MNNSIKTRIFQIVVVVVSVQLIIAFSETQWNPFLRGFLEALVFGIGAVLFTAIYN